MSMGSGGPLFGSGGFFGGGSGGGMSNFGPQGPYGAWPGCGCSSLLMIVAGIFLICGGFFRMLGQ